MSEKQQKLVFAIIDFLNQSIQDGTVKQDDKEGLEVAVQCIGEAFGVDPSNPRQRERLSIRPATLMGLFDQFPTSCDQLNTEKIAVESSTSAQPTSADKAEAEVSKAKGNQLMSAKKYDDAVEAYTQAIARDGTNPVYYSNRAAAYSSKGEHTGAIVDAEKAIELDPLFSKAYHRLGHAKYSQGSYSEAASAFKRGLEIDPSNANMKSGLHNAEARIEDGTSQPPSPLSEPGAGVAGAGGAGGRTGGLADLFGGGGGGMPDIAGLMQNPMMMQMAQQMMTNGGLERLMQNPAMANMMNRAQSGNMPSMQEIMSDPNLRQIASQFMGGGGRGGAPGTS